jgi:group I intron endonuclease
MTFNGSDDLKNKGGIYVILNILNGKFYIGSTVNFWTRFRAHRADLNTNTHHSIFLQRTVNKNGIDNFEFHILQVVECADELSHSEQKYLDALCPHLRSIGYNVEGAVNRRSKETIEKIVATRKRNGNSPKFKAHVDRLNGRKRGPMSDVQKAKIARSQSGKVRSESHRVNNGKAIQKQILGFDWLGYPVIHFNSLKECAKHFGVKPASVCEPIKAGRPYRNLHLVYLTKEII